MIESKRDLSMSMERANILILLTSIPVVIAQFVIFILVLLVGVVVHEFIHGVTWAIFGRKLFSAIKFGLQWNTFTPHAHLKEPVEVNAYRLGALMPGWILGILTYLQSLWTGNGNLFRFSPIHTATAGGDWLIRGVKAGMLVEDHPIHAGCYVLEPRSESV
jgi:hypothetical protein